MATPDRTRTEVRVRRTSADAGTLWQVVESIGGAHGWYSAAWAWRLRTSVDALVGGPGRGRARRDPDRLRVGDPVDFWVVEDVDPPRRLALRALTRMPGVARMAFAVRPSGTGAELEQRVAFAPAGLVGLAYWYGELPLHRLLFDQMVDNLVREAERRAGTAVSRSRTGC